jgi:hypothetical protein
MPSGVSAEAVRADCVRATLYRQIRELDLSNSERP